MKAHIMTCDICGEEGAKTKHVTRAYGTGDAMVVIDKVPVVVCPHCGETYLTAETMHEVERLRLHQRSLKPDRLAPVINYV